MGCFWTSNRRRKFSRGQQTIRWVWKINFRHWAARRIKNHIHTKSSLKVMDSNVMLRLKNNTSWGGTVIWATQVLILIFWELYLWVNPWGKWTATNPNSNVNNTMFFDFDSSQSLFSYSNILLLYHNFEWSSSTIFCKINNVFYKGLAALQIEHNFRLSVLI